MIEWWVLLAAGALGGLGAVMRALLSPWRGLLPWGVLLANTLAAIGIGAAVGIGLEGAPLLLVAGGLAGGLSTFSGVVKDCFDFYHRGRLTQMLANGLANLSVPAACLLAISAIT